MHLLVALPSLTIGGKHWCQAHFLCPRCQSRQTPRFRKRAVRRVVHILKVRVPVYWFQCVECGSLSYIPPGGLPKGGNYSEAMWLVVAIRHAMGLSSPRTEAFLGQWGLSGGPWVRKCVEQLCAEDPMLADLHRVNRHRGGTFQIAGLLDDMNPLRSDAVLVIPTGYVLVSLRGDRQGRQTLGWIAAYVRNRLAGTGAGVRVFRRKPRLSPHREVTFETMDSTADALRLLLDQLNPLALFQPSPGVTIQRDRGRGEGRR